MDSLKEFPRNISANREWILAAALQPPACSSRHHIVNLIRQFMRTSCNIVLGLAGLCLGLVSANAQTKPAAAAAASPKIQFAEPIFDFGKVNTGEVVKHSFVFTNTGSATLEIIEVKPGCGCTTAGTWDKKIEPGKTGSIPLQLNSAGFGGRITKSATITCNDPGQSNVILQITGTVWKAIDVTPSMAMFNINSERPSDTNETRVLRIVSNLEQPITLSEPVCTNQSFRTELKTVKEGKEFELRVTAVPPFSGTYFSAPIKIKTSAKEMPEISTSAYVTVVQAISILPQQITLPAGPLATNARPNVTIRYNSTNKLALSDATINIPGADVTLKEAQPGRLFNLSLNLPPGFQIEPGQKVEVSVKSDHPKYPVIKVPVVQASPIIRNNTAKLAPAPAAGAK
jgi:hypothetical protein